MSTTIRVSRETHETLRQIAEHSGESVVSVLDKAVEAYRRQAFLEQANEAFAALRSNQDAWSQELRERGEWNVTLDDGLKDK